MKFCLIAGFTPSVVRFRMHLLSEILSRGHEAVVIGPPCEKKWIDQIEKIGVRFRAVEVQRASLNPFKDFKYLLDLKTLLREERPSVVLSYTIKPVIYGSLAARLARISKIYSLITGLGYAFMGSGLKHRLLGCVVSILYRFALSKNHLVFFQNLDDQQLFVDRKIVPIQKCCVVDGSGVDLDHFATKPVPTAPVGFLLVARLLRDKGIQEYVEAAKVLKPAHPSARFCLLGPFDDNPTCISKAELDSWIEAGIITYIPETDDVRPALAECSVFVLPSYREGTPRSVLEALSVGRAVITTNAPGCKETVDNGRNGFLVDVRNPVQLAAAMEKFIRDPELAVTMGKQSRAYAEKRFDVRLITSRMLDRMPIRRNLEPLKR